MARVSLKAGVCIDGLTLPMIEALAVVMRLSSHTVITSGTEPAEGRVDGSLHPTGNALDIRWQSITSKGLQALRESLGGDYDVIAYPGSHIHIEYDPQPRGKKSWRVTTPRRSASPENSLETSGE